MSKMTAENRLQERLNQAILDRTAIDQNIKDIEDKIKASQFQPFDFTVPITSKEQAEALYCIFNSSTLLSFMLYRNNLSLKNTIRDRFPNFDYNKKWCELMVILGKE